MSSAAGHTARTNTETWFDRFRRATVSVLEQAAGSLDEHAATLPALLLMLFAMAVWIGSRHKQLWHDELFTYLIARAPDWSTLLSWTRTLDLNPPLSFALARLSLHAFGLSPEAGRLPFMLGTVVCGLALFRTLYMLTGSSVWSALGLALVLEQYEQYAFEMRPYGLQAGFLALAVLAWQSIAARKRDKNCGIDQTGRRVGWHVLLSLTLTAGLLSHLFFVLIWAAFCFAESVGSVQRRSVDILTAVALLLPVPVMYIYRPIFAMHAASYFPQKFQPKWRVLPWFYVDNGRHFLWMLLPGALVCLLLWGFQRTTAANRERVAAAFLSVPWIALLLALGAIPGLLILYLHVTHGAFFWRYGFVLAYVYALLLPMLAFFLWQGRRAAGFLLLAGVVLIFGDVPVLARAMRHPVTAFVRPPAPICDACRFAASTYPHLPLVIANGLTFVEMNERETPETLHRLVYLVDLEAEIKYAHATIFEGIPAEHDAWGFIAPVLPYQAFVSGQREFLVYGTKSNPEEWLLPKLEADGAQVTFLKRVDHSGYDDVKVWHVLLPTHDGEEIHPR